MLSDYVVFPKKKDLLIYALGNGVRLLPSKKDFGTAQTLKFPFTLRTQPQRIDLEKSRILLPRICIASAIYPYS